MAVPSEMLLDWELAMVKEMARNRITDLEAMTFVGDNLSVDFQNDDLDNILAVAERLVILARKAVELRDERREDQARFEMGRKDSDPRVP